MRRWRKSDKYRDKITKARDNARKAPNEATAHLGLIVLINRADSRIVRISDESTGPPVGFRLPDIPPRKSATREPTQRPRACPGREGQIDGEKVGAGVRVTLGALGLSRGSNSCRDHYRRIRSNWLALAVATPSLETSDRPSDRPEAMLTYVRSPAEAAFAFVTRR